MDKIKLSALADDIEISVEESSTVYTVADLKREILELGEPHHLTPNWYTIKRRKWNPDAEYMIERYLEQEDDQMYEDWLERALECINNEHINKIQAVLDEAFKGDYYFTYEEPVEIDILSEKEGNSMTVKGFMEDWDGEMVLSDIRNFENEQDFLKQAEEYVTETRGYKVQVLQPSLMDIMFNSDREDCWMEVTDAEKAGYEGQRITVYKADLDYENAEEG